MSLSFGVIVYICYFFPLAQSVAVVLFFFMSQNALRRLLFSAFFAVCLPNRPMAFVCSLVIANWLHKIYIRLFDNSNSSKINSSSGGSSREKGKKSNVENCVACIEFIIVNRNNSLSGR